MSEIKMLKKDLKDKKEMINIYLDRYLPRKDEYPKDIHKALRHTLFAGGKRLRPYLTIQTFSLFSDEIEKIIPIASALELIHTYTLMHDDLPAMDDDDMRRGKKACHVVYGDSLALLGGNALQILAFELITDTELDNNLKLKIIQELTNEAGDKGIIAGQMQDIISEGKEVTEKTLHFIHEYKTEKLIRLAIRFGCYVANAPDADQKRMDEFGKKIGLAFQIVDDILDIEGSKSSMGKSIGKDQKVKKATFPSVYGLEESKKMAKKLVDDAIKLLSPYKEKAEMLTILANYIYNRES